MSSIPGLSALGIGPKPTKEDVSLSVNGKKFEGWQSISVKRSIKAIAGLFDLSVIDKWAADQIPFQIVPGNECTLSVGSETLITGYIDSVKGSFDKDSRSITISGRDKTGDMVDCSADHKPGNWTKITLLRLANILGAPFDITATLDLPGGGGAGAILSSALSSLIGASAPGGSGAASVSEPFISWNIQNAETAFECLERAARLKGVLLMNDGEGNILITRAGTDRASTSLEQGVNVLSASAVYEHKERHSKYIVKSQAQGLDDATPEVNFSAEGTATDDNVDRFRPLIVIAEGASTPVICRQRAQWEATVRAAKSTQISCIVQGWRQGNGDLWTLNELVKFKSPYLGVNQEFLITTVELRKGNDGTTTVLELERPDAYTPDPTVASRKEPWRQLVLNERARR